MVGEQPTVLANLPSGWVSARLGRVAEISAGNPAPQRKDYFQDGRLPFIRVQDLGRLDDAWYIFDSRDHVTPEAVKNCKLKLIPSGAVLFTKSGMSTMLNQRAILKRDCYIVSHIGYAIPYGGVTSEWLWLSLKQLDFKKMVHSTTLPSLRLSKVAETEIPVPPMNEQKRIIRKLEELFHELRTAREALRKVPSIIKQSRRALLAKAFRGELSTMEPEDKPLPTPFSTSGSKIARERGDKGTHLSFEQEPYELRQDWVWVQIGDMTESSFYGPRFAKGEYRSNGVVTIRTTDMDEYGQLHLSNPPRIKLSEDDFQRFGLREGDLLITRSGSIGKCAIFKGLKEPAIPSAYLIRFRMRTEITLPEFVLYYLLSSSGQDLLQKGSTAVTQSNVNAETVKEFPIPFCSIDEQARIVKKLDEEIGVLNRILGRTTNAEATTQSLQQAILAKAFKGELVPQDSSDESASKVLACSGVI